MQDQGKALTQGPKFVLCKGFYSHPQLCLLSAFTLLFVCFFCVLESVVGRGQSVHLMTHSDASPGAIVHGTHLHFYKACLAQETEAA